MRAPSTPSAPRAPCAGRSTQSNIVDVHVARLRGKLKRHPAVPEIETVRGFGFRLATEPAGA
jgi:DNA-binding response OmpR family regulator